jgi:hypothetical protein
MNTENFEFHDDDTYYEVVDVISDVLEEVLNSDEVKRMINHRLGERQLNVTLPDFDFSESPLYSMLDNIDSYLYMGSVINGREYVPATEEQRESIRLMGQKILKTI